MTAIEAKQSITMIADDDLSAAQFRIVKVSDSAKCDIAADAAAPLLGVLLNNPDADGVAAEVQVGGVAKVKMSGASGSAGAVITATTAGVGVATTTPEDYVLGIALEDWAASALARVLLFGPGAHFPTA